MDALILRVTLILITLFISTGASYRTRNFIATATSAEEARSVAEAAEQYRRRLAIFWTGRTLKNWSHPCTINVRSGSLGAAGQTTFQFVGTEVMNWKMMVQGSSERILDSVLPHEVNHTVFASYFRRPLPRWADEGASTLFEHRSEQQLQLGLLQNVVRSRREFIPLRKLLSMKRYPTGHRPMLILYAEGFGLVDFLMQQEGRETYLKFLHDARGGRWEAAIRKHYNHKGVDALEVDWRSWVIAGMPRYGTSPEEAITMQVTEALDAAKPDIDRQRRSSGAVRGQNPEKDRARQTAGADRRSSSRKSENPARRAGRDASRELAAFKRDRRYRVRAPTHHSSSTSAVKRHRSLSDGSQHAAIDEDSATKSKKSIPFTEGTRFQPTHHHDRSFNRQIFSGAGLFWKRSEETGSTPQWAGFPGQMELF
ncbi:MAG: hypothetical protein MK102_13890 [Fuerstiella sp.]|nr:hypothetical protein [Fuerstiella sp.]